MAQSKNIEVFTESIVLRGNVGAITTFYNEKRTEILSSAITGVNDNVNTPLDNPIVEGDVIQFNHFQTEQGNGILTTDENGVLKRIELQTVRDENGKFTLIGKDADKYAIDEDTGHLIYTEE